ncbi:hypothetical protein A3D80_00940 [Candidatus Roizmanbacteria bacterium RIFCSPHIGHO2_02_FULL_40_13b]|uniref:Multidrug resistance protein MdtA-like C-terminal permuted SH3 domain-containing protein n=1 Tax=Candidatus Roizmanbacteria bacterium RIFCSPHIGHO2_01_FULL_39_24 TaxID=1802032 RepID=A0A1F7GIW4_9BACT|nr:MAG: hypothetical protein A2799_02305 [Candidatus Roizmanbacteria bacterium RIFCSPHIGHO2_01_FULL_39_24]OGK26262.1 MAG: hypothetical protein A3D80_00940 [Candidatus Roizmanbacteria bacterium RIFCSPHIGHO2_02_FULL_40_13b]OGK48897.1 MAG: hypothetical protein A3A56_01700 [Candidatus Roizmanbacteria bacterium RIFCSPLOWO2_01_FULL_40_32]OGK57564.1 MAG: hypothetical protein A3H83_01935 [Candidatus Roizmanbacteria bacterium RIFCSPLOWO2_02_FULL_39_8]
MNGERVKELLSKHKKQVAGVVVILLFVFIQSRSNLAKNTTIPKAIVQKESIRETLTLSGSISADERVVLQFQTAGQLAQVAIKEGDYVKKGQYIASLNQQELKKRLQKQLNTYAQTRLNFDQTKADNKDVALTEAISRTLADSQYTLENSVIDVELNDIAIKYANLYSPIEGFVTSITVPIAGVNVVPTSAQFEIINPNSIYFSSTADQSEITQLQQGKAGTITLDSFTDEHMNATISQISFVPKSGESSTVYTVKLPLATGWKDKYRLGMTGDVEFSIRERQNTLTIPQLFVKEDGDGKKYVNVLKNGKPDKRFVKTGLESDEKIEITSGLQQNDTVYDFTQ